MGDELFYGLSALAAACVTGGFLSWLLVFDRLERSVPDWTDWVWRGMAGAMTSGFGIWAIVSFWLWWPLSVVFVPTALSAVAWVTWRLALLLKPPARPTN